MTRAALALLLPVAFAAALAVTLPAVPALAQNTESIRIRAQKGDTLELLAAEYYGDRNHAVFIMKANDLTHPRPLKPRERIKIPIQRQITSSVGDTLEGLAEEHLGDARRAEFLATFNGLPPDATIPAGQTIFVPFHVTHTAAARETIRSIAAAYFGDAKQASMLRRYNFTEKDTLEKGESLTIPIYNVQVRQAKLPPPDPKSAEREARLREMEERALRALPTARAAWRDGEYTRVKKLLVDLDIDYLPTELAAPTGVLLGAAYIAFDDEDSALATFEKVLRRDADFSLSAYQHSPKVRAVWQRAGGAVETRK